MVEEDPVYYFEYITSTALMGNDRISCHVLNYSTRQEWARVRVYRNSEDGALQVMDSGDEAVTATWEWSFDYEVRGGSYWVQLMVSSEFLVPRVSYETLRGEEWHAVHNYLPGDFAVFEILPNRRRRF